MRFRASKTVMLLVASLLLAGGLPIGSVAQAPNEVVVAETVDLTTTDPQKNTVVTTETVLINIYDTLLSRDARLRLRPGLAVSWKTIDPTTWEFALRRGVRFHNSEPFNANTVKFSLDRAMDPKTKWSRAGAMRLLKGVNVVDDYTVRITTERPWPLLLQALVRHGYMVPREHILRNGDDALTRRPIGSGPYKFVRWVKDDRLELESNPDYWGGRPKVDRVIIRFIPHDATRLAELLAGTVHLNRRVPPEHFGPIERSTRSRLVEGPSISVNAIVFLLKDKPRGHPLLDKRVRQAINLAVDRKAIFESIMRSKGQELATFCTEVMFGCDASVTPYTYNAERARALLREAGFGDGFDLTLVTTEGRYVADRDLTLAVADQLQAVGIRARTQVMESGIWLKHLLDRSYPAGVDASFLPSTGLLGHAGVDVAGQVFHSRGFISFWNNRQFDDLLDAAETTVDEARAQDLLRQAQLLYKDEAPGISLFVLPNAFGVHRDLDHTPAADVTLRMNEVSWKRR